MKITVNITGLKKKLAEKKQKVDGATRMATRAGLEVLYREIKMNAQAMAVSGALADSIYMKYVSDESGNGRHVYKTTFNRKAAWYGRLVERGYIQRYAVVYNSKSGRFFTNKEKPLATPRQVAAKPFIRPALDRLPEARQAALAEFKRVINE